MSLEEPTDENAQFTDRALHAGREKLDSAQVCARDCLDKTTNYIRNNPWIAVAIAAAVGGAIAAVARKSSPPPKSNVDAVREWLDDAYNKLPSKKDFRHMADDCGVTNLFSTIGKKIGLN